MNSIIRIGLVFLASAVAASAASVTIRVVPYDPNFDPYAGLIYAPGYSVAVYAGRPQSGYADGVGRRALLGQFLFGLWPEKDGSLLFSDARASVIRRLRTDGTVELVAGIPMTSKLKNGPALQAKFADPEGIVRDSVGNLYVSDPQNGCIRKIDVDGNVSTLATGLSLPSALAIDAHDNLFVVEGGHHAILEVKTQGSPGAVSVYAGSRDTSGYVDGNALDARFNSPVDLALAPDGTIYVADQQNHVVRKISPSGVVSTIAGVPGVSGDADGPAATAQFGTITSICLRPNGDIAVGDFLMIRMISTAGVVSTPFGRNAEYNSGALVRDGNSPYGSIFVVECMKNAPDGGLYFTDDACIRELMPDGSVETLAGESGNGHLDGFGDMAKMSLPWSMVTDGNGSFYLADGTRKYIRKIDPGRQVTSIKVTAEFDSDITGLAYDRNARCLYMFDNGGGVFKMSADGTQSLLFNVSGMNDCGGMAVDASGALYLSDTDNQVIRKWTASSGLSIAAGVPYTAGSSDGALGTGLLNEPQGLAFDSSGNLLIADAGNNTIRKLDPQGNLTTYAGKPGVAGALDGARGQALFSSPVAVAVDGSGNIFVGDQGNGLVRVILPSGSVETITGIQRSAGMVPGMGKGSTAGNVSALCVAGDGSLYAYSEGSVVRIWAANKVLPSSLSVDSGSPADFSVTPSDGSAQIQWYKDGVALPGQTSADLVIDAASSADAGSYSVMVGNTISESAKLTVVASLPAIDAPPESGSTAIGGTVTFSVSVSNLSAFTYAWQVSQDGGQSWTNLSDDGIYKGTYSSTLSISGATSAMDGFRYRCVATNSVGSTISAPAVLTVHYSQLLDLSVRAVTQSEANPLIVGLINSQPTDIVVRCTGPALQTFGVSGVITDPKLQLFDDKSAMVDSNNDWTASAETAVAQFQSAFASTGLFPLDASIYPKESALLLKNISGLHSIYAFDANNKSGVCLVEMYNLGTNSGRFTAISARDFAGAGDQQLIAGFVIGGNIPEKVLIRAVGPTLAQQGVAGAMPDPKLELYRIASDGTSTLVDSNDNWGDNPNGTLTLQSVFTSVGEFSLPVGSKDAVLLESLKPGVYTANVTSVDGAAGQVMIEVYEVP